MVVDTIITLIGLVTTMMNFDLQQLHQCSQYVTLQIKIGSRKVKTCQFGSSKWFWPSIFAQITESGLNHSKA
jgi:hypothetical protein